MQDDDDNDDPMILNIRAKNHTSERTIVPWTVIFFLGAVWKCTLEVGIRTPLSFQFGRVIRLFISNYTGLDMVEDLSALASGKHFSEVF